MKSIVFASLALGAALILIPSSQADSIGSKAIGSNAVSKVDSNFHHSSPWTSENRGQNDRKDADLIADKTASDSAVADMDDSAAEMDGKQVSQLSEGLAPREEAGAAGSSHFVFREKSGARGNAFQRATIHQAADIVTLAETPEPESLFLLGTGLLCMALAVFWKSAKRSSEQ